MSIHNYLRTKRKSPFGASFFVLETECPRKKRNSRLCRANRAGNSSRRVSNRDSLVPTFQSTLGDRLAKPASAKPRRPFLGLQPAVEYATIQF